MADRSSLRRNLAFYTTLGAAGLVLAACGATSGHHVQPQTGPKTVDAWFIGPMGDLAPVTGDMEKGIELALAQHGDKAGHFNIKLRFVDPSTVSTGVYDPQFCATIGNAIAADPNAVVVFAPFNSGCVKEELKTLGDEGVPVLSATNTYLGLTQSGPGIAAGEPGIYQSEEHPRNYFRLVAPDNYQAAAALKEMQALRIKKIAVANDQTTYGAAIAAEMVRLAPQFGVTVVSNTPVNPQAADYGSYARTLVEQNGHSIGAFFYGASNPGTGIHMFDAIHHAMPHSYLFGPDGLASSTLTWAMPASAQPLIRLTIPVTSLDSYPGGSEFRRQFEKMFPQPAINPYALPAYVNAELAINGIAEAAPRTGADAGETANGVRDAVRTSLQKATNVPSAMGPIGFTSTGDTTAPREGAYRDVHGNLTFSHPIALSTREVQ